MDRRTAIKTGGMALLGLGVGGCASRTAPAAQPMRPPLVLPLVQASWDRVIRTTVGLRPHRPSGFRLGVEKLDDRTVVHNYGHGGAGMSLSWGTGSMAADMALKHLGRRAAVIGCGAVGLTAARQLQRRGFDVTIYATSVPPNTTSNMSLAGFTPTSGLLGPGGRRTPAWTEQFQRAAEISYRQLQLMAGQRYGVSWITQYSWRDTPPDPSEGGPGEDAMLPLHLRTGQEVLGPGEHPFPGQYATRSPWMRIEPSIYLDALVRDFLLFGGRITIRTFETRGDLMSLGESLIVNCSGLGSRDLFDDDSMTPVKGQLTLLTPQPEIDYGTFGGVRQEGSGSGMGIHMNPRSDGIALGGTSERGESDLTPNEDARQRVVDDHIELFEWMRSGGDRGPGIRDRPARVS